MPVNYSTPQQAEAVFYQALERADLPAMLSVWAEDDTVACVHPLGSRLQGREAVRESWRRILSNGSRMRFRITDATYSQGPDIAVHVVHENITLGDGRTSLVIATNVFKRTGDGWRMILHHASPAPAGREAAAPPEPEAKVLH